MSFKTNCVNTTYNMYKFDGKVPKIFIPGEASDFSHFCKLDQFGEVIFWDETIPFPKDALKLRYQHEHSKVVDPAIAKILTYNGQVIHRSM